MSVVCRRVGAVVVWLGMCGLALGEEPADPAVSGAKPAEVRAALKVALESKDTPELVRSVAAEAPEATRLAEGLAADPEALAAAVWPFREAAKRIAARDGEAAEAFSHWLVEACRDARRRAPQHPGACLGLAEAWAFRARVLAARGKTSDAEPWIEAANQLMEHASLEGVDPETQVEDAVRAITLPHVGAEEEGAPVRSLLDHASLVATKALERHGDSDRVRRTVARSFWTKANLCVESSRRVSQQALGRYFDAFGPIAEAAAPNDIHEFNRAVTFARLNKIDVKVDYISVEGRVAEGLLAFRMPQTGRWRVERGEIVEQMDSDPQRYRDRSFMFGTCDWNRVYSYEGDVRTTGGDNVKGVANIAFRRMHKFFSKVKKTRKPARKRLNKTLPSGIWWMLQGLSKDGDPWRISAFYVKAVKAEKTLEIMILERVEPEEDDPELEALYDSFDITKKER